MAHPTRRALLKTGSAFALAALATPALVGRASAAVPLTVASLFGADKPETKIWLKIKELAEAKLPGAFTFNIVQNAALGGEKEVAQAVKLGSVQASLSTMSVMSGWVPETQILDLPFLFRDAAHLKSATSGDLGADLRGRFAAQGFEVPAYINYGARHLLTKTPVTEPSALKGVKIRVIQSPLHTRLWSAYGAVPVGIPIVETYNALQTGVADAMDLTKSAYAGFKLYEVVPDMTTTAHIWASGVVYFGQMFWAGLSAEQKAVLTEVATEGAAYFDQLIVEDEVASMATAMQAGGKELAPTDLPAWQQGALPVWQDMARIVGGMDLIEKIRDLA